MYKSKLIYRFLATSLSLSIFLTACSAPSEPAAKDEPKQEARPAHWSYEGDEGPTKWAGISPEFAACADGKEQSPIDIELGQMKLDKTLTELDIRYQPAEFTVMNNGHTVQINDMSGSNSIVIDDREYKLVQMHFHKPSEHRLNGQSFEMEGHLVHEDEDGKLAVLGFLIKEGKENKELAEIWSILPEQETKEDLKLNHPLDLNKLLPEDKKVFRYNGSLTTPPCTEGVKWMVLEQPIEMSEEQIQAFGAIFQNNHRPIQPVNNRIVMTK